jgi:cell division protein ZapD
MKELDRQKNSLLSLKNSSNIDQDALLSTLEEMNIIWGKINQTGKTNAQILESEWLSLIRSRLSIPGGTSPVDLPAYYAWQFTDANIRRANLKKFVGPLMSWKYASQLFLKLLRGSGKPIEMLAPKGSYQQMLSGKTYQLMRVGIHQPHLIPEISANKYMLWTRFMTCDGETKPRAFAEDVSFELSLCNF